jgi:FkbM family methyltransferase
MKSSMDRDARIVQMRYRTPNLSYLWRPLERVKQAWHDSTGETRYRVGRFELVFPPEHMLGVYQHTYKLYDSVLGEIARLVTDKYPGGVAIDIGANVGDTAAVICRHRDIPVLCIEGHPVFADYLRRNLPRLPPGIELADCFVGPSSGSLAPENLKTKRGTASIGAAAGGGALQVRRLAEILRDHRAYERPRLIKTDTDGFDFDILLSSLDVLRDCMPVVFTEYDPISREDGLRVSVQAIEALVACGYRSFAVYDNFGNFLELVQNDVVERFRGLSRYLMSNFLFGRAIYYLDVCAFGEADEDLARQLQAMHAAFIDHQIRNARETL